MIDEKSIDFGISISGASMSFNLIITKPEIILYFFLACMMLLHDCMRMGALGLQYSSRDNTIVSIIISPFIFLLFLSTWILKEYHLLCPL